jgi:parallel beta-helix repeat protein
MTTDPRVQQRIEAALSSAASTGVPVGLLDSVLTTVSHTRMRPQWLALIKEPPMRIHSRVAAGSPALRLVAVLILLMLLAVLATGTVVAGTSLLGPPAIVVAQDGSGTVTSISEGVAMAQDGDTVLIKPGTYHESVAITEDIAVRGDGERGSIVLEFADDGPTLPVDGPFAYGLVLDHSDAHIQNITVRGRVTTAGEIGVGAVIIDGGDPVIEQLDVILDGEPYPDYAWLQRSAFQITGGSNAMVRHSSWDGFTRIYGLASHPTFEDNTVTGQRISIWAGRHRPTIRGNALLDGADIVFADPGVSAIIEDNDIDGSIFGYAGDDTTIRYNHIRGGGEPHDGRPGSAIGITGSGTALVEGNDIVDSPYGIDVSGGARPQVSGNTVRGSASSAILVDFGTGPTIDGNIIEGNATGIEVRGATTTPVITGNSFCGNKTDLSMPEDSTLTLDGNTVCTDLASTAP